MSHRLSSHDFRYEATDIPEGMTIGEWRRRRARGTRHRAARGQVATFVREAVIKLGAIAHRGGGARSGLAAKHGVLRGGQAPPFGLLRES